jgi:hypothetical protein
MIARLDAPTAEGEYDSLLCVLSIVQTMDVKEEVRGHGRYKVRMFEELKQLNPFCAIIQYYSTMSMVILQHLPQTVALSITPRVDAV